MAATGVPEFSYITARQNEDGHGVINFVLPRKNPPQRIQIVDIRKNYFTEVILYMLMLCVSAFKF